MHVSENATIYIVCCFTLTVRQKVQQYASLRSTIFVQKYQVFSCTEDPGDVGTLLVSYWSRAVTELLMICLVVLLFCCVVRLMAVSVGTCGVR